VCEPLHRDAQCTPASNMLVLFLVTHVRVVAVFLGSGSGHRLLNIGSNQFSSPFPTTMNGLSSLVYVHLRLSGLGVGTLNWNAALSYTHAFPSFCHPCELPVTHARTYGGRWQ
jgi:hypothetical protein